MRAPALVGLMGRKRSGKDSFASVLVEEAGYVRLGFADALRAALLRTNPLVGRGDLRVADYVERLGWEGVKGCPAGPEIRRLLQEYGMGVREIDPDFWVRVVTRQAATIREGERGLGLRVPGRPVVVTDVRFPNEADALRAQGGIVVRIDRPGQADEDDHVSEHAWRDVVPDYVVENSGTLDALAMAARSMVDVLDPAYDGI